MWGEIRDRKKRRDFMPLFPEISAYSMLHLTCLGPHVMTSFSGWSGREEATGVCSAMCRNVLSQGSSQEIGSL